jgi:putative Ca2+/H+ antiporter (TMEM165/GDT1 family)
MLQVITIAFATVFVAELGDKSQLLALSLSARYRRPVLLAAVLCASALTIGASVLVGSLVGQLIPEGVLGVVAGILFLGFAVLTLRQADEDAGAVEEGRAASGFATAVLAMSVAEFGDKTMLAALTLASTTSAIGVWIGGTLGMAAAGTITVVIGGSLWRRLTPWTVRLTSAALFAIVGILLLVEAVLH